MYTIYQQALMDVKVFPIPDTGEYIYADSWGQPETTAAKENI